MGTRSAIIVAIITSVMCSWGCRNAAIYGDQALRTNSKFFPMHYTIPRRWIRKLFSLPKRYMAKHLVFQLYFSLIHIALGVINVVILLLNFPWSEFAVFCIITCMFIAVLLDGFVCGIWEYVLRHK